MGELLDQLKKVPPCDDRGLIQILTQILTQEIIELREKACSRFADTFQQYGVENFKPCEVLTEEFLEQVQEGNTVIAIDNLLRGNGYPPYIVPILTDGFDALETKSQQEIYLWLLSRQEIKTHPDTARYVREKRGKSYSPKLTQEEVKKIEDWYTNQGLQEITSIVEKSIQEFILSKIKCPPQDKLEKLINIVNNLVTLTNRAQETFDKLQIGVNVASATVSTLNTIVDNAKKVTTANDVAIVGLTASGVGVVGVGPLVQASRLIDKVIGKYEPQIEALDKTLCAAAKTVQFINLQLSVLRALLEVIDALLQACINKLGLDNTLRRLNNYNTDYPTGIIYNGYLIEVRKTPSTVGTLVQRYAVALDEFNTVVLEGPRSFSSSTQVLVDEIKFRIDNQLG